MSQTHQPPAFGRPSETDLTAAWNVARACINAAWQARYTFHSTDPDPLADPLDPSLTDLLPYPSFPEAVLTLLKALNEAIDGAPLVKKVEHWFTGSHGVELPGVGPAPNWHLLAVRCAMAARGAIVNGIRGAVRNEMHESSNEIAKLRKAGREIPAGLKGRHKANVKIPAGLKGRHKANVERLIATERALDVLAKGRYRLTTELLMAVLPKNKPLPPAQTLEEKTSWFRPRTWWTIRNLIRDPEEIGGCDFEGMIEKEYHCARRRLDALVLPTQTPTATHPSQKAEAGEAVRGGRLTVDGPDGLKGFKLGGWLIAGLTPLELALLTCLWRNGEYGESNGRVSFQEAEKALYPHPSGEQDLRKRRLERHQKSLNRKLCRDSNGNIGIKSGTAVKPQKITYYWLEVAQPNQGTNPGRK